MTARVQLREITNEEGQRLFANRAAHVGIGRDVAPGTARTAVGASDDPAGGQRGRVQRRRHRAGGNTQFQPLEPLDLTRCIRAYKGSRSQTLTVAKRQEIKRIALTDPRIPISRFRPRACRSWRTTWSPRGW